MNPFYWIGPLKVEYLSREPEILQFYNMIGYETAKELLLVLSGKAPEDGGLYRDQYYTIKDPTVGLAITKRIVYIFIPDYSKLPRLSAWYRHIHLATRFDPYVKGLEPLQCVQSTFAGHHSFHQDHVSHIVLQISLLQTFHDPDFLMSLWRQFGQK